MKKTWKQKIEAATLALMLSVSCAACGSGNGENGTNDTVQTGNETDSNVGTEGLEGTQSGENAPGGNAVTIDDLLAECTYLDKEMYERATAYPEGDISRIAAALRKAEAGEAVTIGVIGGSITQGSSASSQDSCYASLLKKWWEETFPQSEITFINAGVGSTTSYLGVHRVEEDLLSYEPDLVIVEFGVNDANSNFYKKSYDNLVRRIMMEEYNPAVLLLFMTMEDGTSAQGNQSLIGFQYEIPMISYGNIVLDEIKEGSFTWDDISPDNIHPNNMGHAIVAETLDVYLTDIYNRLDEIETEVTPFNKDVITKEVYMDATILYADDIEPIQWGSFEVADINSRFPGNWYTESGEESLIFEVEAANIGIMYQEMVNGGGGKYEVYVDGEHVTTLNADFANGWGDYSEAYEIYTSAERTMHTVEIKKAEDSEGSVFALLGLLIS
ncbi:MAG: SGNH/GDSL hydrolase family protein [Lachnospiraceae bacterium]|nr:SGNH/GDSL hydrolase family protein [Lachnospiraceae bacterium]